LFKLERLDSDGKKIAYCYNNIERRWPSVYCDQAYELTSDKSGFTFR